MKNTLIIAIDGLSGSGKGSVAKRLAKKYHMEHLETGLLYRAVGYYVRKHHLSITNNEASIIKIAHEIDIKNLHTLPLGMEEIAKEAAAVGKIPQLRVILTKKLQEYISKCQTSQKGVILDGRDIGTCVYPNADLKFFLTSSLKVRALRRFKQLNARNHNLTLEQVENALALRDNSDKYFNDLAQTNKEYIIIDSTHLTLIETLNVFTSCINRYLFVE